MPKPQWLKDKEQYVERVTRAPNLCCDCIYFGKPKYETKHKGKERVWVHECDIHPGCMNTRYSYSCSDWQPDKLL